MPEFTLSPLPSLLVFVVLLCRGPWWCVLVLCFILLCCGMATSVKQGLPLTATATVQSVRVPCLRLIHSGPTSMKAAATRTLIDRTLTLFWMTWPADAFTAPPQLLPPTSPCPSVPWQQEGRPGVEGAPGLRSLWLPVLPLNRMWPSSGQRTWSNSVTLMCLPDESKLESLSYPQFAWLNVTMSNIFGCSMPPLTRLQFAGFCLNFLEILAAARPYCSFWILWASRSDLSWQHKSSNQFLPPLQFGFELALVC